LLLFRHICCFIKWVEQKVKKMRYLGYGHYLCEPKKSSRVKLVLWSLFLIIGIPLLLVPAAEAQTRVSVERELEKTDNVIERAKDAFRESRNPKAENLLEMAVSFQKEAKGQFHMIRYRLALDLTLKARKRAYEAIGFTKKDEENENLVLKAIERTDQIISKAQDVTSGLNAPRVLSLLDMATGSQQKAKEFFREHRLKAALKLTLEAKDMANKVLGLVDKGVKLYQLTKRELEITDRLMDKASVIIQESQIPKAVQLLDQANDLQSKAQEMFAQNKFGQASKSTKKARDLAKKALEMVEKDITPLMVENAIQQNEKLIEKETEKVNASGNPEAEDTFQQGLSHQNKAKEYYHEGKFQAALAEAKVALRLINKALEMVEGM
jgi:tetratricopeptide (TPR) repeat protein